ncbi:MAG TPA: DNA primase [Candidatus Omnitrophica bacterium]|nr:DNA primase [Candidatus Omnitrophota bacterium]
MIPEEIINRILAEADIVRIIEEFWPLKPAGKNYKALCPFHQEKTPSFIVSPEKQIFHCFGCGKGGNVFHFIMEQEKMSFPEAVKFVGERLGIHIEERTTGTVSQLYSLLEQMNSMFVRFLYSPSGKGAYRYLINRGIKEKTLKDFSLGFAPDARIQLREINNKGFPSTLLEKGGIITKKDQKEYPYFRRRIIFPIFNPRGKVIAFGGRNLDESSLKYLNSPETEIFEKGKTLYGLNLTKKAILNTKKAIITEGYMDLITLYQAGIQNAVASLGTSLTRWQVKILSRMVETVYVIYDSDIAGEKASLRALELCIEEGLTSLISTLPSSEDPDSFIRKYGKEKFLHQLTQSRNIVQFYLEYLKKHYDSREVEGKIRIAKEILPIIDKIPSELRKSEYIKMLAEELNTEEYILLAEMKRHHSSLREQAGRRIRPVGSSNLNLSFPTQEELILSLLMEKDVHGESIHSLITREEIDDFQEELCREIAHQIYKRVKDKKEVNPSVLMSFLSPDARAVLSQIMVKKFIYQDPQRLIRDWRRENIRRKIIKGQLAPDECQRHIEKLQKLI